MTLVAERCSLMCRLILAEAGAGASLQTCELPRLASELQWAVVWHAARVRHLHRLYHNHVNKDPARGPLVKCLAINTHRLNELSSPPSHNYTALFAGRIHSVSVEVDVILIDRHQISGSLYCLQLWRLNKDSGGLCFTVCFLHIYIYIYIYIVFPAPMSAKCSEHQVQHKRNSCNHYSSTVCTTDECQKEALLSFWEGLVVLIMTLIEALVYYIEHSVWETMGNQLCDCWKDSRVQAH